MVPRLFVAALLVLEVCRGPDPASPPEPPRTTTRPEPEQPASKQPLAEQVTVETVDGSETGDVWDDTEDPPEALDMTTFGPARRVDITPELPATASSDDKRILFALRRQFFLGSVTEKAAAQVAIAEATPSAPDIVAAHRKCVRAQRAITLGKTWLEQIRVAKDGWTDDRTGACMDAVMAALEARGWVEESVAGVEALSEPPQRRAYGLAECHLESDDFSIRRVRPLNPHPLARPDGLAADERVDIIVHIAPDGQSRLAGVVNADPGAGSQACYASVAGNWTRPYNDDAGEPNSYCRFIRCRF